MRILLALIFSSFAMSPPDVWHLLVFSLRLLPVEATPATPAYDQALAYRLELVTACKEATEDRTERYICTKMARFESAYREDVGRCALKGKEGEVTAWQIIPRSKDERTRLCVSLVEDARFMLERVRESRAACRRLAVDEQLASYARGSCSSEEGRKLSRHRWPRKGEVDAAERY